MKVVSFEKSLARLESIVEELESGELPLDVMLKRYEEGIRLSRLCGEHLSKVEKKVELLLEDKAASAARGARRGRRDA